MEPANLVSCAPGLPGDFAASRPGDASATAPAELGRFRALVDAHYDFVWRSLRRLGVEESAVDDSAQRVFLLLSSHLGQLRAGCERAFLLRTAMGVAANQRRSARLHRREVTDTDALDRLAETGPSPEELLRMKRARLLLDKVLDGLGLELRTVLVLVELEGLTAPEVADLLEVPLGTVASRLRRAKAEFQKAATRIRAREDFRGKP